MARATGAPPVTKGRRPPPEAMLPGVSERDRGPRRLRLARIAGTVLIVAGLLMVAWTVVVLQWQDPFTALYTTYQQHKLASKYKKVVAGYQPLATPLPAPPPPSAPPAQKRKWLAA